MKIRKEKQNKLDSLVINTLVYPFLILRNAQTQNNKTREIINKRVKYTFLLIQLNRNNVNIKKETKFNIFNQIINKSLYKNFPLRWYIFVFVNKFESDFLDKINIGIQHYVLTSNGFEIQIWKTQEEGDKVAFSMWYFIMFNCKYLRK